MLYRRGGRITVNTTIRNCNVGMEAGEEGSAYLSGFSFENNETAGIEVRGGDFIRNNLSARQNRIGLELHKSARGGLFKSNLTEKIISTSDRIMTWYSS